jgi:hypothetical protein
MLRLSTGVAAGTAALLADDLGALRIPLGIVGLAGLATGAARYCPMKHALGLGTEHGETTRARKRLADLEPTPGLSQY